MEWEPYWRQFTVHLVEKYLQKGLDQEMQGNRICFGLNDLHLWFFVLKDKIGWSSNWTYISDQAQFVVILNPDPTKGRLEETMGDMAQTIHQRYSSNPQMLNGPNGSTINDSFQGQWLAWHGNVVYYPYTERGG